MSIRSAGGDERRRGPGAGGEHAAGGPCGSEEAGDADLKSAATPPKVRVEDGAADGWSARRLPSMVEQEPSTITAAPGTAGKMCSGGTS